MVSSSSLDAGGSCSTIYFITILWISCPSILSNSTGCGSGGGDQKPPKLKFQRLPGRILSGCPVQFRFTVIRVSKEITLLLKSYGNRRATQTYSSTIKLANLQCMLSYWLHVCWEPWSWPWIVLPSCKKLSSFPFSTIVVSDPSTERGPWI